MLTPYDLDLVMPVHNEEGCIASVVEEWTQQLRKMGLRGRILLSEDGSTDRTKEILRSLEGDIVPLISDERKGYSKAVIDGLRLSSAPWVLCLDSDGQYDPGSLPQLWKKRLGSDLIVGCRAPRQDQRSRLLMSWLFRLPYRALFSLPLSDPSCAFVLVRRDIVRELLGTRLGTFSQGFWWEFMARAASLGVKMAEVKITHRQRLAGKTQIYHWRKVPGIAAEHLWKMAKLKIELAAK